MIQKPPLLALLMSLVLTAGAWGAPILRVQTVTNTDDSGLGSLRQAINAANSDLPDSTEIIFDIPASRPFTPFTIQPLTPLPDIFATVFILGDSQPGFFGAPVVEIDGGLAAAPANGLTILSDDSVVRGLTIGSWRGDGIHIEGASRVVVEGCRIGTDITGVEANSNVTGVRLADASLCRIGGPEAGQGNLISGNFGNGVSIFGFSSLVNSIQGNLIGTDVSGNAPLKNGSWGIRVDFGAGTTLIGGPQPGAGNVVAANGSPEIDDNDPSPVGGIRLSGDDHVVQGNLIGLGSDGTTRLGNSENGIRLEATTGCLIGGPTSPERNVIADTQHGSGLTIMREFTEGTLVQGNFIGTDATGTEERSNNSGIRVSGALGTVIGGLGPGEGNLLSGNRRAGIEFSGDVPGTVIQGNLIGTDATGLRALGNNFWGLLGSSVRGDVMIGGPGGGGNVISGNGNNGLDLGHSGSGSLQILGNLIGVGSDGLTPLGNGRDGIEVLAAAAPVVVGSLSAGNVIAHSGEAGVRSRGDGSITVRGNRIFANGDLGIDRGEEGVTPIDIGESDGVPNFPQFTGAVFVPTGLSLAGSVDTFPSTGTTVDFYLSPTCDASGHGEGWQTVASLSLLTSPGGTASFNEVFPIDPSVEGRYVTATSTVFSGDTSEFSPCVMAIGRGPSVQEIVDFLLGLIPDPGDLDLNMDLIVDSADVVTRVNASPEEIP